MPFWAVTGKNELFNLFLQVTLALSVKDQYVLPILADMVAPVWVVILDQDFYASAQLAVGEPFVKVNCILFSIWLLIIVLKGSSYEVILG